jgi:hypothetical protein
MDKVCQDFFGQQPIICFKSVLKHLKGILIFAPFLDLIELPLHVYSSLILTHL